MSDSALSPDRVPGLTDDEKLWAALSHASCVLGFAFFGPLVIWMIHNSPEKSQYVAHKAKQAMIAQGALMVGIIIFGIVTCGIGVFLLFPWFGYEIWLAVKAHEGQRKGYPGMAAYAGERGLAPVE